MQAPGAPIHLLLCTVDMFLSREQLLLQLTPLSLQEQEEANRKIMRTLAKLSKSSGGENLVEGESPESMQEEGKGAGAAT